MPLRVRSIWAKPAADEGIGREGPDGVARAGQRAEDAGAGEVDVVGDVHRLEQADRGGDAKAGLVDFERAAVEGDRARAERARIADAKGGIAVDGGAARVAVRGVEDDRAAVADEVGSRRAGDRTDDDRVATAEDRRVDLKRAAARAESVGTARSDAQAGGGVVAAGGGTEIDTVVRPHSPQIDSCAVAQHVDGQRAVHRAARRREGHAAGQRPVVAETEGTDAIVVGVHRGHGGTDVGRAEDAEGRTGIDGDGAGGGELLIGGCAAADAGFDLSLLHDDVARIGGATTEEEVGVPCLVMDGVEPARVPRTFNWLKVCSVLAVVPFMVRPPKMVLVAALDAKCRAAGSHRDGTDGGAADRGAEDAVGVKFTAFWTKTLAHH